MKMSAASFLGCLMLLFLGSCCQWLAVSAQRNNLTDLLALLDFKAKIQDPEGFLTINWTTNSSFCNWNGVSCSHRRLRVTALMLHGFSIQGTISPHLANLSFLTYLDLGNNTLTGPIPESLGHLPRLRFLNLEGNQLSGAIPTSIFNMSILIYLYLNSNILSGTLPANKSNLAMLPQLKVTSLGNNNLNGEITSGFSQCRDLEALALPMNHFSGIIPVEFANLPKLRLLYLGQNNLTGTIPAFLTNLTKLTRLDLSQNNLHGVIPSKIGKLNLELLQLNANRLSGPIPGSLTNTSMLTYLDLAHNYVSGQVPVELGANKQSLYWLNLGRNQLHGSLNFIALLSNCKALQTLDFSHNELSGVIPDSVGNLSAKLLKFNANTNLLTGEIPPAFGNLSGLIFLNLNGNKLSGTIPLELTKIERLQVLYLGDNRIGGSIPPEIGRLQSLVQLTINGNALSSTIPDTIGNISRLYALLLGNNRLSSSIPTSLWGLTGLLELNLSHNFLQGSLPPGVGNLKAINILDLSSNLLSGSLPNASGELQMLATLDLSNNSLQGLIPPSFQRLISLEYLDLSSNNLGGKIPEFLAELKDLAFLNLSFNNFEGQIPDGGAFLSVALTSLIGNKALCGTIRLGFPPCPRNATISYSARTGHHLLKYIIPVAVSAVVLLTCLSMAFTVSRHWRRSESLASIDAQTHHEDHKLITYRELVHATDNFNKANLLGRGSFSSVFRGCLDNGSLVAIKVISLEKDGAPRSFVAECQALRNVRHRNLVRIISTCSSHEFKALILPFMSNGNLESWLQSENYCLSLLQRITIMHDVALAMEHLHHHHHEVIVHCDLKPSNVLLDDEMIAHVGDFGIAKILLGDGKSIASANMTGTFGYMAPEYGSTGRVSTSGDVYSYGILLLETFTGKKPTNAMFEGETGLRQWVSKALPEAVLDIADPKLLADEVSGFEAQSAERKSNDGSDDARRETETFRSIMELGLQCSSDSPKERITMQDVVLIVQKIKMEYLSKL